MKTSSQADLLRMKLSVVPLSTEAAEASTAYWTPSLYTCLFSYCSVIALFLIIGAILVPKAGLYEYGASEAAAWTAGAISSIPLLWLLRRSVNSTYFTLFIVLYWPLRLGYSVLMGDRLFFGDTELILPFGIAGVNYWLSGGGWLIDFNYMAMYGSKYSILLYYFGLPFYFFGVHPDVLPPVQILVQFACAAELLWASREAGFGDTTAKIGFFFTLLFPEFVVLTSMASRDILILWCFILWLRGLRGLVHWSTSACLIYLILATGIITLTRVQQLPILFIHLVLVFGFYAFTNNPTRLARFAWVGALSVMVLTVFFYQTGYVLSIYDREELSTVDTITRGIMIDGIESLSEAGQSSSGGPGGALSRFTSLPLLFIAVPMRIFITVVAPFPWTKTELFIEQFQESWVLLLQHIIKVIIAMTVLVGALLQVLATWRLEGDTRNGKLVWFLLALGIICSTILTFTGFGRYYVPALPLIVPLFVDYIGDRPLENRKLPLLILLSVGTLVLAHVGYYIFTLQP